MATIDRILFGDNREGSSQVYFTRLACVGEPTGPPPPR